MKRMIILMLLLFAKSSIGQWKEFKGAGINYYNDFIKCMVIDDSGNIYIGGDFTNAAGFNYVSKYDKKTGGWLEVGDALSGGVPLNANGTINKLAADHLGNLYAAGFFTNAKGSFYVAKWIKATNEWIGLPDIDTNLLALEFFSLLTDKTNNLYVSGAIHDSIGSYVAKWDGLNWTKYGGYIPSSFGIYATEPWGFISHLNMDDRGVLYAENNGLIMYNVSGVWTDALYTNFYGHAIKTMVLDPDRNLYLGGEITDTVSGYRAIFKVNTATKTITKLGKDVFATGANFVNAIAVMNSSEVYAAGFINDLGGSCRCYPIVKKWNKLTDEWTRIGNDDDTIYSSIINCMVLDTFDKKGNLLIGGEIYKYAPIDSQFIAEYQPGCHANFTVNPTLTPHTYTLTNYCYGSGNIKYTWDWDDGSPTDTGMTPSHTYATAGYYGICVYIEDSLGCTSSYCLPEHNYLAKATADMVYVNVEMGAKISEKQAISTAFEIFPNPTKSNITVVTKNDLTSVAASFKDMFGKVVFTKNIEFREGKCDIAISLPSGLYILEIMDGHGNSYREKIVFN